MQTAFISGDKQNSNNLLSLVEPLLKNGCTLWMDNFYNLLALAESPWKLTLLEPCFLVGKTLHKEWKKLKKGELVAQHSGPVSVLKWKDKKEVTVISAYHGEETRMKLTKCWQQKKKPVSVLDYNENMNGVDLKDQLLQPYLLERKKMTEWLHKTV